MRQTRAGLVKASELGEKSQVLVLELSGPAARHSDSRAFDGRKETVTAAARERRCLLFDCEK